jgi:DNA-directed RNA polymerase specialized sigma24 family protein
LQQLTAGTAAVTLAQLFRLCDALDLKACELLAEIRARARALTDAEGPAAGSPVAANGSLEARASSTAPPAEPLLDADLRQLVALARGLPPDTRRVFTLRKVYGLSPLDIAARLQMSVSEVARHLVIAALACDRSFDPPSRFQKRFRWR